MKRILCIWLPSWPIQRLTSVKPELESRPVVLHQTDGRGQPCVASCSPAARQLGVRLGMPLAEATALANHSADQARRGPPLSAAGQPIPEATGALHCQDSDPASDREALADLAVWCERFSPRIGLQEAGCPESLLLDITGLGPLFGGEEALVERIAQSFTARGLVIRIAIAQTVGAAWALARYGPHPTSSPPPTNDTSLSAPHSSTLSHNLDTLPVRALRLSEQTVQQLEQLGIRSIGQLTRLPHKQLLSRFGPELLKRLDQVSGSVAEVVPSHRHLPEPAAHWSFEFPTGRYETVRHVVGVLTGRVAEMLAERSRGALALTCRLDSQSRSPLQLPVRLFQPSAAADHLLALLQMKLEPVRLTAPVTGVYLTVTASAPLVDRQKRLFDERAPRDDAHQLAGLIDRLVGRLGRQAVLCVRSVADAQPELAYCYEPLIGDRGPRAAHHPLLSEGPKGRKGREGSKGPPPTADHAPLDRPLYLYARPVPIEVVAIAPDGPPARFRFSGRRLAGTGLAGMGLAGMGLADWPYRVTRHWGPERIETGWWRAEPIRRDYYRVETDTGHRFWLFRRLDDARWYLHAPFG